MTCATPSSASGGATSSLAAIAALLPSPIATPSPAQAIIGASSSPLPKTTAASAGRPSIPHSRSNARFLPVSGCSTSQK